MNKAYQYSERKKVTPPSTGMKCRKTIEIYAHQIYPYFGSYEVHDYFLYKVIKHYLSRFAEYPDATEFFYRSKKLLQFLQAQIAEFTTQIEQKQHETEGESKIG